MVKRCAITGKKFNNGYSISHSHVRIKKRQNVNLQSKKIWLKKDKRWIKVCISAKAIKSIYKV